MADYRTHLTVSSLCGLGYGLTASLTLGFAPVQGVLAGCLTGVAGMLPDLDSESGRPVRELSSVTAALAPLLLMPRLERWSADAEGTLLLAVLLYIAVRYGAGLLLGLVANHRGMFHSLPALGIAAELTYLGYTSDQPMVKGLMAGGVALGFASHLLLDEIYSVEWNGVAVRLKSSAGSAFKLLGRDWGANIVTYGMLFTLTYAVLAELGRQTGPGTGTVPAAVDQFAEPPQKAGYRRL